MLRKSSLMIIGTLAMSLPATAAFAQGGYVGASIGQTDIDLPDFDKSTSFKLTGGYKLNDNFAFEAAYIDFGDAEDDIDPVFTIEASGINIAAVGIAPLNDQFSLFGKLGVLFWDAELKADGFGKIADDDGSDISLGFGAMVNATDQLSFVLEYERFKFDDEDADTISAGVRLHF